MATEVDNHVPETKEIKEEAPAADAKAEEAKQENAGGDAPAAKEKEPAPPKVVVHRSNYEKDTVYLYQFSRTPLLPSLSPYCLKVETWLRLAGIKYEVCTIYLHALFHFETVALCAHFGTSAGGTPECKRRACMGISGHMAAICML